MSLERPTEKSELFPAGELRAWVEERYARSDDDYSKALRRKHLRAIEDQNLYDLEDLSNVLFVTKSTLQGISPEEYVRLTDIYDRLMSWLKPRMEELERRRSKKSA